MLITLSLTDYCYDKKCTGYVGEKVRCNQTDIDKQENYDNNKKANYNNRANSRYYDTLSSDTGGTESGVWCYKEENCRYVEESGDAYCAEAILVTTVIVGLVVGSIVVCSCYCFGRCCCKRYCRPPTPQTTAGEGGVSRGANCSPLLSHTHIPLRQCETPVYMQVEDPLTQGCIPLDNLEAGSMMAENEYDTLGCLPLDTALSLVTSPCMSPQTLTPESSPPPLPQRPPPALVKKFSVEEL